MGSPRQRVADDPPAKRRKMAQAGSSAAVPVTAYRYNEKNIFSLILQSSGLETPLIYETEHTFAVLDKYPLSRGHALLIVKHPAATLLDDLPPAVGQATFVDLQCLARAVQRATGCAGLRIQQSNGPAAGQTVPQLHFHVVPVYESTSSTSPAPTSATGTDPITTTPDEQQHPQQQQQAPRKQLDTLLAGPLLAHIRNALPERYSPGYHVWAETETDMEALGWALQQAFSAPGTVVALSGQLGAGKSTISRGFVRAFVRDPLLEVPSPTFLLCLSYQDDTAYEKKESQEAAAADAATADALGASGEAKDGHAAAAVTVPGDGDVERPAPDASAAAVAAAADGAAATATSATRDVTVAPTPAAATAAVAGVAKGEGESGPARAHCVHHMDPYRLGAKNDKMAGLIDFGSAFRRDVCLIEWPDRMPGSVMELLGAGVAVDVSGMGAQASGRLVTITPLGDRFKPPPPKGKGGAKGAGGKQQQQPQQQQQHQAGGDTIQDGTSGSDPHSAAASQAAPTSTAATAAVEDRASSGSDASVSHVKAAYERVLQTWRRDFPASLPPAEVAWRGSVSAADLSTQGSGAGAGAGASGASSTINAAAAAAIASGDPTSWVVLGIESSCDDTAAAVVRGDGTVLAHQIASQTGLHEQYGGVKPDVARQAHASAIQSTVDSALAAAGVEPSALTAVSVTCGPGLALCLQVGVQHGLALAARHRLPFVPVHHMEAHAMMTRLPSVNESPMQFPSLLLLVSGGHNMLVLCEGVGRHRIIGTTLDDSVGECFDKIARVAGIAAVPGGPYLERMAASARPDAFSRYPLTIPLANGAQKESCNFSFSGLKTQVVTLLTQKRKELGLPDLPLPPALAAAAAAAASAAPAAGAASPSGAGAATEGPAAAVDGAQAGEKPQEVETEVVEKDPGEVARLAAAEAEFTQTCADVAASFQRTAVRFLQQRTRRALQWLRDDSAQQLGPSSAGQQAAPGAGGGFVRSLVVAGGVAANQAVRAGLSEVAAEFGIPCVYPPVRYCTDNGLMVAWTGVERLRLGLYQQPPRQSEGAGLDAHVQVIPRWPIGPMDPRSTANKGRAHMKLLH